ncbi:thiamine/thiamine pyrophosphate ABC transporter, permease protein [Salinivibrio kushneri]|uniref:thiamine/thiamine pyrophosphate ABC transporter permease n=1 Tax=Salinivibrio kushneri TaxID=1908198 RepID=UPI0009894589|nr:thiamine/thiamine pyrophosphate ABC transporter permease [Salinivibrio kushneri]OOE37522.1 thiamine/thiamine pyrophosphate ABC transporter, permease protein [Salinivibrio kushneri]
MLNPSRTWPGSMAASLVVVLIGSALWALFSHSHDLALTALWQDTYLRHVTYFSFKQATLSVVLSVGLAIPVAHALYRRQFPAKAWLLKLFAMTLVLPVLVGVFGLVAIYGRSGWIAQAFAHIDASMPFSIYGLSGILLAHVFFNLPFSAQLMVQALEGIPADQRRLATQLGLKGWQRFKHLEWPYLRQSLPHIVGLVFMLCFTSFATVMALGGGPKATTIELAIYQAIHFDFDLQTGAVLALWQMLLCGAIAFTVQTLTRPLPSTPSEVLPLPTSLDSRAAKCWDSLWIGLVLLLVLPPLGVVIARGLNPSALAVLGDGALWQATLHSLAIASGATSFAFVLAAAVILASRHWRLHGRKKKADGIETLGAIILVVPSIVLSTGLFLLFRQFSDVFSLALWLVMAVNALMALPYLIKVLSAPAFQVAQSYHNLCATLGVRGITRLRLIEWDCLRAPIARGVAVSFVLSMGDLSAIALFGSQNFQTLPLYLFRLMGSYQMEAGAAAAMLLLLTSLGCYALLTRLIQWRHAC